MSRAGVAACALVVAAAGVVAFGSWQGSKHEGGSRRIYAAARPTVPSAHRSVELAAAPPDRAAVSTVRTDLFGSPPPPPAMPVKVIKSAPAVSAPPPDPLAGLVYNGLVQIGDKQFAVVENSQTREGSFLQIGDPLAGLNVTGFDSKALSAQQKSGAQTLAMNDAWDLLPLDRDAAFLGGKETPHNQRSADKQQIALATVNGKIEGQILNFVADLSGDVDIQKMKNDVFDGRMTQQEYDQKVGSVTSVQWNINVVQSGTIFQAVQGSSNQVLFLSNTLQGQGQAPYRIRLTTPGKAQVWTVRPRQAPQSKPLRHLELPDHGRTYLCGGAEAGMPEA